MPDIIDTAEPVHRHMRALSGITTYIRYLSSIAPHGDKVVTPEEARAIRDAGKRLALVHEGWGGVGGRGIDAASGKRDGEYSVRYAPKVGAPDGAAIYFAVDTDTSPAYIRNKVIPYFREVYAAVSPKYRVGIYGPGAACDAVIKAGLAELGWLAQARGWAGYKAYKPKAHLVQLMPTHIGGVDLDPDVAQVEDWGDFVPYEAKKFDKSDSDKTNSDSDQTPAEIEHHSVDTTLDYIEEKRNLWDRMVSLVPPALRSPVTWFTGGGAASGIGAANQGDPAFFDTVVQSMQHPTFWFIAATVVCGAGVAYYHWKSPSGPKSWL